MKSALLAQNDNLAIENLKQKVGRSVFDLSHSTTFPIDVDGAILPICCIETVPSDSFEISCECLLRQLSPLQVPLMANFRLNTAWFWCDNRLAWKKWDRFMTGGRSGNEVYDIPRVANFATFEDTTTYSNPKYDLVDESTSSMNIYKNINYKSSLHTYFGICLNHDLSTGEPTYADYSDYSDDLPVAFPFFDYQMICRDFYTNVDRLPQEIGAGFYDFGSLTADWSYSNLFPADDDEIRLIDGVQINSGFISGDDPSISTRGFVLDKVRYHNVRDDYFVSSKKAPMRGDAPTINAVSGQITLPSGTKFDLTKVMFGDPLSLTDGIPISGTSTGSVSPLIAPVAIGVKVDNNGNVVSNTEGKTLAENSPLYIRSSDTESSNIYSETKNDVTFGGDFVADVTAGELRLLSQLTVWQELNMLHEPYYNDFLNAHFEGVSVGESAVEKPQYIGGTSQNISINEVLQTSQSSETSPLGNQGATAMSLASNYVGKYYCNNYGYLIGVAYIITDMYYNPALPRWTSRRTKEDFYSPEFANLSMQAILNKEIYFSNSDEWNNTPWGYVGSFDELRTVPNRVAGDLLNDDYTDLKKWVIRREFDNDNKPSMSSEFLSLKDNVDKTAWSVPTMPAFMLQCANYIKAVRPMPKVAIPKAL